MRTGRGDEKTPCWRANVSNRVCRAPVPGIMLRSADNPFAVCAPQRPFYPSSPDRSHLWLCKSLCAPVSVLTHFSGLAPLTSVLMVALLYNKLSKPSTRRPRPWRELIWIVTNPRTGVPSPALLSVRVWTDFFVRQLPRQEHAEASAAASSTHLVLPSGCTNKHAACVCVHVRMRAHTHTYSLSLLHTQMITQSTYTHMYTMAQPDINRHRQTWADYKWHHPFSLACSLSLVQPEIDTATATDKHTCSTKHSKSVFCESAFFG